MLGVAVILCRLFIITYIYLLWGTTKFIIGITISDKPICYIQAFLVLSTKRLPFLFKWYGCLSHGYFGTLFFVDDGYWGTIFITSWVIAGRWVIWPWVLFDCVYFGLGHFGIFIFLAWFFRDFSCFGHGFCGSSCTLAWSNLVKCL